MKYVIIVVFVAVYVFFGTERGFTADSAWWTHLTYWLQHGSIMHLVLNVVSMLGMMAILERFMRPAVMLTLAIVIAIGVSWLVSYSIPVVGASGVVYALIGMYMLLIVRGRIRFASTFNLWLFFVSVFIFLIISFVKTNSAGMLHFLSMCAGFVCFSALLSHKTI
jgi:membrane associated rhomboid family serine protease